MKKVLKLLFLIISVLILIGGVVKGTNDAVADQNAKASLKIVLYEQVNGSLENEPLKGSEFTIYKIANTIENKEEAEEEIKKSEITKYTKTTQENGIAEFTNLEVGRYFVVQTNIPKNATSKVESFIVDLPRTSASGNGLDYNVTIYPKIQTIYGELEFTYDLVGKENREGIVWRLEKKDKDGEWQKYVEDGILTTDKDGDFSIANLEVGEYKLTPITEVDEYVTDQNNPCYFSIGLGDTRHGIILRNNKVEIDHEVKLSNGEYGKDVGVYTKDNVSWKTTTTIPTCVSKMEKYIITEKLEDGLEFDEQSLKVNIINGSGFPLKLTKNVDYNITELNEEIVININPKSLDGYKTVEVSYDTSFDTTIARNGEFSVESELEYTNYINTKGESTSTYKTSDNARVYTGSVLIYKTDENSNPLQGAQFRIAETEEKAKNGDFIKDSNNNYITAISGENGYVIFNGLKIGQDNQQFSEIGDTSYWIVEVQAPSYNEDNVTKYYSLKKEPIEVIVNKTSGIYNKDKTTVVVNKKEFILPLTGGKFNYISKILGTLIILTAIAIKRKKNKNEKEIEIR